MTTTQAALMEAQSLLLDYATLCGELSKGLSEEDAEWGELRALGERLDRFSTALLAADAAQPEPIDMVLHCRACGVQHIDAPDERTPNWKNEPHRSHLCHGCGHIWRPADVPTNGVAAVKTKGKADSPIQQPAPIAAQADDHHSPAALADMMQRLADAPSAQRYAEVLRKTCGIIAGYLRALSAAQAVANTSERHFALREAHEIASEEAFFKARPELDGGGFRPMFNAGFVRGFDAAEKVYATPAAREAGKEST